MKEPKVSVLIPTYKRAHLIGYALEGLRQQTYRNFEVIIVLKPSGDGTEEVIKNYENAMDIRLIRQEEGYVTDALNIGLAHVDSDIVAFLDDDAIPFPDWIQNHVNLYTESDIGGVAGDVTPIKMKGNELIHVKGKTSEIIPSFKPFLETIGQKIWNKPLEGLENYLVYISKAGAVAYNTNLSQIARCQPTKSLLGMGANMSILFRAVENFSFPSSWILGLAWEQFLGWHLWKKGFNLVFNPNAKVYHIFHEQTLTRNIKEAKRNTLRIIEHNLLFYQLFSLEHNLSKLHRIVWLTFSALLNIKKICKEKEIQRNTEIKSMFQSEIIGLKWLISRKLGGYYSPLIDLERLLN